MSSTAGANSTKKNYLYTFIYIYLHCKRVQVPEHPRGLNAAMEKPVRLRASAADARNVVAITARSQRPGRHLQRVDMYEAWRRVKVRFTVLLKTVSSCCDAMVLLACSHLTGAAV